MLDSEGMRPETLIGLLYTRSLLQNMEQKESQISLYKVRESRGR